MFVGAIERLVTLGPRIPAHADGQDMGIGDALQRCEIKLQPFILALFVLQPPASHGGQGRHTEKPFLVFKCSSQRKSSDHFPSSFSTTTARVTRSEEHTSELQSRLHLVCRLLLEKK